MKHSFCKHAFAYFIFLAGVTFGASVYAQDTGNIQAVGEKLTRNFWAQMKATNIPELEKLLAPGFQSVHVDGPRDRAGELTLVKNIHLGEYTLKNFKTTQAGSTLITTFSVSTNEMIDGKSVPKKPAERIEVWSKTASDWELIAYANLNAI